MLLEFDFDADIIDVPHSVIDQRNQYRNEFFKWLSDPKVKHKYWQNIQNRDGSYFIGLGYRSEAFVEWLNRKLRKTGERATIVKSHVPIEDYQDSISSIFF